MIAALLHLLVQLATGWLAAFGHPAPPVPVPPVPVVQALPGAGPDLPHQVPSPDAEAPGSSATVAPPVLSQPGPVELDCLPGEEWQGEFGCVAVQLPEERDGRAYG